MLVLGIENSGTLSGTAGGKGSRVTEVCSASCGLVSISDRLSPQVALFLTGSWEESFLLSAVSVKVLKIEGESFL